MKWTKEQPLKEGFYWVEVTGYGTLFPHAEGESAMIVWLDYSEADKCWEIIVLGDDVILEITDELGIKNWSDEPIPYPELSSYPKFLE